MNFKAISHETVVELFIFMVQLLNNFYYMLFFTEIVYLSNGILQSGKNYEKINKKEFLCIFLLIIFYY
jgi:tryptophan-rich sensory protein